SKSIALTKHSALRIDPPDRFAPHYTDQRIARQTVDCLRNTRRWCVLAIKFGSWTRWHLQHENIAFTMSFPIPPMRRSYSRATVVEEVGRVPSAPVPRPA